MKRLPGSISLKKILDLKTQCATTEKECLAVVQAFQYFGIYLAEADFTVVTDHKALQHLNSARHTNGRVTRWALQLQLSHLSCSTEQDVFMKLKMNFPYRNEAMAFAPRRRGRYQALTVTPYK